MTTTTTETRWLPVWRGTTPEEENEYQRAQQARYERSQADQRFGEELDVVNKMRRVFELERTGLTFEEIGKEIGVSKTTAWRMFYRYLDQTLDEAHDVENYRAGQLAEIDYVRARILAEAALQPVEARPFTFAAPALTALQKREQFLVGLKEGPPTIPRLDDDDT